MGVENRSPPEQLPIVLQVRPRELETPQSPGTAPPSAGAGVGLTLSRLRRPSGGGEVVSGVSVTGVQVSVELSERLSLRAFPPSREP